MIDLAIEIENKIQESCILVTGGAGFIGSHIVENLLAHGCKYVRILDNLSTGKMKNIYDILKKYEGQVDFMYGDISDLEVCRRAVSRIDLVCHQAALGSVPRSIDNPLASHKSNVDGMFNLLVACQEAGVRRFVYASSSSVYGDDNNLPKTENRTGKVLSPYAATKLIDEVYAGVFSRVYQMECIGLRYFNVFGPRQDPNGAYAAVIPKFTSCLIQNSVPTINGGGEFSRDFTYIDNVVQANILALTTQNQECFGEAFNIGNGGQITIDELYDQIRSHLGSSMKPNYGPVRKGDIPHSNADISKAVKLLDYSPNISFEEGIKRTVGWFKLTCHN